MAELTIEGNIIKIFGIETRGNYSSNKMWIETKEQYPQSLEVVTTYKKETLFDGLQSGQSVVLSYNLRGRAWTNPKDDKESVFNKIEIWKVTPATAQPTHLHEPNMQNSNGITPDNNNSDMPF